MSFDVEKKNVLEKAYSLDKSKKGSIDEQILSLLNVINKHPDYYTTSSCAGRIMLMKNPGTGKKYETEWLFSSHDAVSIKKLFGHLEKLPKETLWLRLELPILHICARNMDAAETLMRLANDNGFRRAALIGTKKRIMIELMIPEKLDTPISENNNLLVNRTYLSILLKHANARLKTSREKMKKLEKKLKLLL